MESIKIEREGEIVDLKCNLLIGADGAHSWTRRYFKMGRPKEMMIGFQADVSGLSGKDNWLEMYTGRDIAPGLFTGLFQQAITLIASESGKTTRFGWQKCRRMLRRIVNSSIVEGKIC